MRINSCCHKNINEILKTLICILKLFLTHDDANQQRTKELNVTFYNEYIFKLSSHFSTCVKKFPIVFDRGIMGKTVYPNVSKLVKFESTRITQTLDLSLKFQQNLVENQ